MTQHHKWSVEDIENLYPYERDIYVDMLLDYLEREKERLQKKSH